MIRRRLLLLLIAVCVAIVIAVPLVWTLAPGGWTPAKVVMLISYLCAAPWVGLCFANGLTGFIARLAGGDPEPPAAIANLPRTAIAVTVRNEDMTAVLPPLRTLLDELEAAGAGDSFALFILSDTNDSAAVTAEEQAVEAFRAHHPVNYRRRANNEGFKAGNIMDFLDHHAGGFTVMLVLDADSRMSARAVLRLVTTMRDDPTLGIVQHLTVGLPASSAFPRFFQFGMRAGMRSWATAQAWWQGDEACYWGHNAVIRIAPFRAHCRLPLLPGGIPILSHDQVEAALLSGAGWGVRLLAEEDGSAEANPPALPEFTYRELRWLAGNFQYRHLLGLPGLRTMGRWQLVQAIMLFAGTPFYLVLFAAAAFAAATDGTSPFPAGPALAVTLAWSAALYAPKWFGYLEILLQRDQRERYGGTARFLAGMAAETMFTLLLDAITAVGKTIATAQIALGRRAGWAPQNRADRGVTWGEAARLFWPQTLIGIIGFAGLATSGWKAVLWGLPLAGGLLVSIPFCVLTASPALGARCARWGLAAIPEEIGQTRRRHSWRV